MATDRPLLDSRVANRAEPLPAGIPFLSSHWEDYGDEPGADVVTSPATDALLVELEPNKWAVLVDPGAAIGGLHLWPGQRESLIRPKLAAAVAGMQHQLARGVLTPCRLREITTVDGVDFERRGWQWSPVLGPGSFVEWLDEHPVVCDRLRDWPETPQPIERPETARVA